MNLIELVDEFRDEDKCRAYLEGLRWPNGLACLRCGSCERISHIESRKLFECLSCGYQFSVTVGTIFGDTHLPLWKWFAAVYLIGESRKGISSNQLKRTLGVSYKTAWYLSHRIRAAMKDETPAPLRGIIEADETWIGGKKRGVGRGNKTQTMVLGAMARDGEVRFKVAKRRNRKTLETFISTVVADDAEAVYTDDWAGYDGIGDANTRHESVNHSQDEWVRADVHTQGIEGVWSLFKRSVVGSYHHQLSAKHLPAYLDEMAFRFNNRDNPYLFRDTLLRLIKAETMPYAELIADGGA